MGTFQIAVEIADPRGQQFEAVEMLLGAMALEDAMLAVDPHSRRLMPVDALEIASTEI